MREHPERYRPRTVPLPPTSDALRCTVTAHRGFPFPQADFAPEPAPSGLATEVDTPYRPSPLARLVCLRVPLQKTRFPWPPVADRGARTELPRPVR